MGVPASWLAPACERLFLKRERPGPQLYPPLPPSPPMQVTPFDCPVCRVAVQMFVSRLQVRKAVRV